MISDGSRFSTQEGLNDVVQSAYEIYHYDEQDFARVADNISNSKLLRNALGFLCRLQTTFKTFIRAAERLSNFQDLHVIPVTMLAANKARLKPSNPALNWSVAKTCSSLGLSLDDRTVGSIFVASGKKKQPWTKRKLGEEFDKLKSPVSQVHAEVQVSLAAALRDYTGASIFTYVGCSKRSCFLCSKFLQTYWKYRTRGRHGKLYNLWTMPEVSPLVDKEGLNLVQALERVERDMKKFILNKQTKRLPLAPESSLGGSSVATVRQSFGKFYTMSLALQYLEAQRGRNPISAREEGNPEVSE